MATATEAMDALLSPMIRRYAAPKGIQDPKETITEYAQDLEVYTRVELEGGWKHLRQTHARQSWPHFPEILKAISDARPAQDVPTTRPDRNDEFGIQRQYWWRHAENSPAYPEALAAGVPLTFRNMAARLKRWPQIRDISKCKEIWARHCRFVSDLERTPNTSPIIIRLGRAMSARNQELLETEKSA